MRRVLLLSSIFSLAASGCDQLDTTRIVELSDGESEATLRALFEHMQKPDFQCRFRWQDDSMAFWDNRAVQHYAVADYTERRVMHRVTIDGPPVS